MTRTIIEESKWHRGKGYHMSKLLRSEDQTMCCLGFDALRRGFTPEEITDQGSPCRILCDPMDFRLAGLAIENTGSGLEMMPLKDTQIVKEIIDVNDNMSMSDTDRKLVLTHLFNVLGTRLEFVP